MENQINLINIKFNLNELKENSSLRERIYFRFRYIFEKAEIIQNSKLYYRFNRFMFVKYINDKYYLLDNNENNYYIKLYVINNKTNLKSLVIYFNFEDIINNSIRIKSNNNSKSVIIKFLNSEHFNCFINSIPIYTKWTTNTSESGYVKYAPIKLSFLNNTIQQFLKL